MELDPDPFTNAGGFLLLRGDSKRKGERVGGGGEYTFGKDGIVR